LHSSAVLSAPREIQSSIIWMIGSASGPPDSGMSRPGPWPRSFFTRKLFAGSPGFTRSRPAASGRSAGRFTRLLSETSSVSRTSWPWRAKVEWQDGSAQLVCRTRCTLLKERMPLRFAQAPSSVQASASAIG
jgi:hypothetical protein